MSAAVGRARVRDIAARVAAEQALSLERLVGGRDREAVRARWRVFAQATEAGRTRSEIGRYFGMDHTTVLHGLRRLAALERRPQGPRA